MEASLVYKVSSRTDRATQRNPVLKNKKKPNNNKTPKSGKAIVPGKSGRTRGSETTASLLEALPAQGSLFPAVDGRREAT